jgi:hypothetical protein
MNEKNRKEKVGDLKRAIKELEESTPPHQRIIN